MSGGVVSGNTSSAFYGGGVSVGGIFTMNSGTVSGNTSLYGIGVFVYSSGTFIMSGAAWPERILLEDNTPFITINGPLNGGIVPIDLGVTVNAPLQGWLNKPVLKLGVSYSSGNLTSLKEHFTLGNATLMESPYTETPITGYKIDNSGLFVVK
jgi:hypothetical protein